MERIIPKPGVYDDVSFDDYLSWDAVSNSRLSLALKSLMHYYVGFGKEPTPAMRLGSFLHCGVLEPLAINQRYAVMPAFEKDPRNVTKQGERSFSKGTSYYQQKENEFLLDNATKQVVEQATYDALLGVNKALHANPTAREYLTERGRVEVSVAWEDEETGLLCKARYDLLNSRIADLKSCADAMKFPKSIANFGYHRQGFHYTEGWRRLTGETKEFCLIAVESTPPFGVRAAPLSEDAIDVGRSEVKRAMRQIAQAKESGVWPGYEDPSSWCLPSYYGGSDEIELIVNGEVVHI